MAEMRLNQGTLHNLHSPPLECPKRRPLRRTNPRQREREEAEQNAYLNMSLDLGLQLLEVLHDRPVDSAT